jgi:type IV secretory pathway TrbD component
MSDALRHEFATRDIQADCPSPILLLGCLLSLVLFAAALAAALVFLVRLAFAGT